MEYWTNTVTLYSLCGSDYVRTGEFEGCFWKREDSLIYENGRRRKKRDFTARIPGCCLIEPGDVLVLGRCNQNVDEEFLEKHRGDAFKVRAALQSCAVIKHTRAEGRTVG